MFQPRFAVEDETRSSARYRWNCRDRGPEPFVIVQWTKSGQGIFRCEGRDHPVPRETAFVALIPEDSEYHFETGAREPWRFTWINFYGELGVQLWRELRSAAGPVLPLAAGSAAGTAFSQLIADTLARRFADVDEASAASYRFFLTLRRQLGAPSTPLTGGAGTVAAVQRAGGQTRRTAAGVKALASEAGVTREHFSRVFKAEHGASPGQFLRRQRLEHAGEMMRATSLPLKEIALRCGFTSARHLADAYRTRQGALPARPRAGAG